MPRRTAPALDIKTLARDPSSGRRIDPTTGKSYRRSAAQIAEFEQAILDIIDAEHPITLRRLHYALVSSGHQPNTLGDYRALSARVTHMRRDDRIPYEYIVDNAREVVLPQMFDSVAEFADGLELAYRKSPWTDMDDRVIVMVEKDAVRTVLGPTTNRLGVGLAIARGRASETFLYEMGRDAVETLGEIDGDLVVYYLGDWDPTGWANPIDIEKRLRGFIETLGEDPDRMQFHRLGLDPAQITALALPPIMAAKQSDPNYRSWPGGNLAVELDAVPAPVMQGWVRTAVLGHITQADYDAAAKQQVVDRKVIEGWAATP